ncbi:DUF4145 domain-containing protein [Flavobacterium beibuense]|uniref:DUF4145 domain containing protein n=1 Tax=Flavobacterium beibuense TaxID=657326 RepID=A0A444WFB1_9FLAO|nr:DUF4145 domain-containing protein [Flavobacterium beibuense]RYJ44541.1 DUF4145 domain containing protein [Flavobacterium beibuense]
MIENSLELPKCPFCNVDSPSLVMRAKTETRDMYGRNHRYWGFYSCNRCGSVVSAAWDNYHHREIYPQSVKVDDIIPAKARTFLQQAIDTIHASSASIMVAASSIDAMLKEKGYIDGSLYARIDKAASEHLITKDMAEWAHHVRLESNKERHADYEAELPTPSDAQKVIDFTLALAEFLFVLPSKIEHGLKDAGE